MCWSLYLAVPSSVALPPLAPADPDDSFSVWRIARDWPTLVFDDPIDCWVIGDARHCSCGRVKIDPKGTGLVVLDDRATQYLAETADRVGHAAFVVDWAPVEFDEETLAFEAMLGTTSDRLRRTPSNPIPTQTWVCISGNVD